MKSEIILFRSVKCLSGIFWKRKGSLGIFISLKSSFRFVFFFLERNIRTLGKIRITWLLLSDFICLLSCCNLLQVINFTYFIVNAPEHCRLVVAKLRSLFAPFIPVLQIFSSAVWFQEQTLPKNDSGGSFNARASLFLFVTAFQKAVWVDLSLRFSCMCYFNQGSSYWEKSNRDKS